MAGDNPGLPPWDLLQTLEERLFQRRKLGKEKEDLEEIMEQELGGDVMVALAGLGKATDEVLRCTETCVSPT